LSVGIAILIVLFVSGVLYALVPGIGAFQVRAKWRRFRRRLAESTVMPVLSRRPPLESEEGAEYRLFGRLEAIQGKDRIWIASSPVAPQSAEGGTFSAAADLKGVHVYILPSISEEAEPQSLPWSSLSALPEGAQVLLAGPQFQEEGRVVFRSTDEAPLLVVFYDGDPRSLLSRAIWCGRQRNEYWNSYTALSLVTGLLALFLLGYLFLQTPGLRLPALLAFTFSSAPVAALLPPGVLFLFLYRRLWKQARLLRAERDLFLLPTRQFGGGYRSGPSQITQLPDGETYKMLSGPCGDLASIAGEGLDVVSSSLVSGQSNCCLFGAEETRGGAGRLVLPRDPMAPLVLTPGEPSTLARLAQGRARLYEGLAAISFALDLVPNLILVLLLLGQLVW
jgi:hypothetical protein